MRVNTQGLLQDSTKVRHVLLEYQELDCGPAEQMYQDVGDGRILMPDSSLKNFSSQTPQCPLNRELIELKLAVHGELEIITLVPGAVNPN